MCIRDRHIPVSILVTVFVFAGLMHLVDPVAYASPLAHLFTGGLMLGAIFMATDYVTSPMTHKGMIIYGVAIGFLTVVIRLLDVYKRQGCSISFEPNTAVFASPSLKSQLHSFILLKV